MPPPSTKPFTAAISGADLVLHQPAETPLGIPCAVIGSPAARALRSAPAQNAGPAPLRTPTCSDRSALRSAKASPSA